MANYARYRDIHLWTGLILLLPVTVIASTGFLWNHEKTLGIKQEREPKTDPPRVSSASEVFTESPLRANSELWREQSPAIDAAIATARDTWGADAPLERIELKQEEHGLVVKVKVASNDDLSPEEIVWSVSEQRIIERKGDRTAGTDWAKIVHDLHTGKFFSKRWGFLWSDAGAAAITLLGITGIVLYLLPFLKKRTNRRRRENAPAERRPRNEESPLVGGVTETA